jgi:glycosyltransferase involved in cell wall biosynthesis
MTKRVCFIRQSAYPYDLSFRREVETLRTAGFEVHVISLDGREFDPKHELEEVINGVFVHRVPLVRKKTSLIRYLYDYFSFFFLAAFRLTILHLKHPFDVIQVNTMPDFLIFATLVPKITGAKVTIMMQEPVPELWQTLFNSQPPRILEWIEQAALAYADTAFTVTQQLKDVYINRGADAKKIYVTLNSPEVRFLEVDRYASHVKHDPELFTLISHGAIEERYGHETMLEAVALIKTDVPGLRLRILGAGGYLNEILVQIQEKGLESIVDYLGWVPLSQLVQELLAADVGIVAQKSSPYSNLVHTNKMYEFIELGKPVLASRLKSVEAYFGEEALYYFEPGNPKSLAEGILDLYRHPLKRQALVEKSQEVYNDYRWMKQKEIYQSAYQTLLR